MSQQPLTLTILPRSHGPQINNIPVPPAMINNIPQINYNPIQPIIINHAHIQPTITNKISDLPLEDLREKERKRLEADKVRCARYRQKVADYKKIGTLKTEKEKFTALAILCYPELKNMNSIELDQKVSHFIASLRSPSY